MKKIVKPELLTGLGYRAWRTAEEATATPPSIDDVLPGDVRNEDRLAEGSRGSADERRSPAADLRSLALETQATSLKLNGLTGVLRRLLEELEGVRSGHRGRIDLAEVQGIDHDASRALADRIGRLLSSVPARKDWDHALSELNPAGPEIRTFTRDLSNLTRTATRYLWRLALVREALVDAFAWHSDPVQDRPMKLVQIPGRGATPIVIPADLLGEDSPLSGFVIGDYVRPKALIENGTELAAISAELARTFEGSLGVVRALEIANVRLAGPSPLAFALQLFPGFEWSALFEIADALERIESTSELPRGAIRIAFERTSNMILKEELFLDVPVPLHLQHDRERFMRWLSGLDDGAATREVEDRMVHLFALIEAAAKEEPRDPDGFLAAIDRALVLEQRAVLEREME